MFAFQGKRLCCHLVRNFKNIALYNVKFRIIEIIVIFTDKLPRDRFCEYVQVIYGEFTIYEFVE